MLKRRWLLWLIVWLALHAGGYALAGLLFGQQMPRAATIAFWASIALAYVWLLAGVFAYAQPRWLLWSLMHAGLAMAGGLVALSFYFVSSEAALVVVGVAVVCRAFLVHKAYQTRLGWRWPAVIILGLYDIVVLSNLCWMLGYFTASSVVVGITAMVLLFTVGLWLIRLLLAPGIPVFGVARTLIDEALRMRIALVFIVLVLLVIPILPNTSDPRELLRYRVATFLSWSMWAATLSIGFMTVFLSCATICTELREKQIYFTLTKPVARWQYLLGKWLGIVLLNALLLAVSGLGIYAYARLTENMAPPGSQDLALLQNQVLVARAGVVPVPAGNVTLTDLVRERAEQLRNEQLDPTQPLTPKLLNDATTQAIARWHTIPPLGQQTYVFTGLQRAKETSPELQLKLKPNVSKPTDDDRVWFQMEVNGRPYSDLNRLHQSLRTVNVIPIPTSEIDDDGRLSVTIFHRDPRGAELTPEGDLSLDPEEGLELLYRYGSFGPNLARGMVMLWIHMGFVAMVGLAAGSFLGFPVACLLTLMIFLTSLMSGYFSEALDQYAAVNAGNATLWEQVIKYPVAIWRSLRTGSVWSAVKVVIQMLGVWWVKVMPSFGRFDPVGMIAQGKAITPAMVGRTALTVGLLWTGIAALIGWAIFSRRELARVTV